MQYAEVTRTHGPEEAGRMDDAKKGLSHRYLGYPIKDCYVLKKKIQALLEAKVFQLQLRRRKYPPIC